MKKVMSLLLSIVMLFCMMTEMNISVSAAEEYDYSNAITSNLKNEVVPYNGLVTDFQGAYWGSYSMSGVMYTDALYFKSYNNVGTQVDFNLQNCFKSLSFYPGYIDGDNTRDVTITIYADGVTLYSITLNNTDIPKKKTISLLGVNRLTITTTGTYNVSRYGLGGINIIRQEGKRLKNGPYYSKMKGYCDPYYGMGSNYQGVYWDDFSMAGVQFKNGLSMLTYNAVDVGFGLKLDRKYKSMSFYVGHIRGRDKATLYIKIDGTVVRTIDLSYDYLNEYISLDLNGAEKLEFLLEPHSHYEVTEYGLGKIEFDCIEHIKRSVLKKATVNANGTKYFECKNCGKLLSNKATINRIDKIKLSSNSYVYSGASKKPVVNVRDSEGNIIKTSNYTVSYKNNINAGTATATIKFKGNYSGTVNKTFTIKKKALTNSNCSIKLSSNVFTYNGKAKKPTVKVVDSNGKKIGASNYTVSYAKGRKNVGKYSVKVTFKGNYSGSKTLYFTIKPRATSIVSLSAKAKGFVVKWNKRAKQTTGYQIQYSTSSKFNNPKTYTISKSSTTSKRFYKLSAKKKYFVRVRTYKVVNGKKYYSAWSSAKSVKTK